MERNEFYHSDDSMAPRLLPQGVKLLLRCKLMNLKWPIFAKGIYEYVIARTKYIDEKVKEALEEGVDQIFIFGAGFDTRANRSFVIDDLEVMEDEEALVDLHVAFDG